MDEIDKIVLNAMKPHFNAYVKACNLTEVEQRIFYEKYFLKEQNWKIAQKTAYSERQVQRIYNRVKKKIEKLDKESACPK